MNTIVIGTINHSEIRVINQLSYLGGPHPVRLLFDMFPGAIHSTSAELVVYLSVLMYTSTSRCPYTIVVCWSTKQRTVPIHQASTGRLVDIYRTG